MLTYRSIIRLFAVAAMFLPAAASAQRDDQEWLEECRRERWGRNERRESFCEIRETRVADPGGSVSIEGLRNGGISATGWERRDMMVRTRIKAQARTEARARQIASQVRTVVSGSTVTVEGPSNDEDESWTASIVASLPHRTNLRLETRNGPVSVERITGDMNLRTSNGPLSLREIGGDVRARTTNGPLTITLVGSRWDGAGLDASTTNGPLTINVPNNYNARLETGTRNGPVNIGFPITVVGRITRDISTDLGSGGATIRATTTNGPLTIRRR